MDTAQSADRGPQVQVRFHTRQQKHAIPDTAILVPTRLRRFGLSEIINHLLDYAKPVPFEFLIGGKFLRSSLQTYLDSQSLSTENTLDVEYIESTLPPKHTASLQHDDWVASVEGHRRRPFFLTGSYDHFTRVWDRSGKCLAVLKAHEAAVKSIAWLPSEEGSDAVQCISGGQDQKIFGWEFAPDQNTSRIMFECAGHTGSVDSLAVNPRGTHFASASWDGTVRVWTISLDDIEEEDREAEQGRKRRRTAGKAVPVKVSQSVSTLEGHVGAASSVVYDQSSGVGDTLFTGGWDHSVRVWDVETGINTNTMNCERVILSADHTANSSLIVTGHADNAVRLWDPRAKDGLVVKLKLSSHTNWVSSVRWSPANLYTLVSGSYDSTVRVWDVRSSGPLHTLGAATEVGQKVLSVDWVDDIILSGGEDSQLRVHSGKV
ncbi:WD40-repeat-containing domain protein [Blyttiomyces helicus]|uniref:Ribosome biogenesis protein YTM1 n=1 Tax=Blyttiomyces helicus TaxID=388810 RepID=A0A4P9WPA5_9FUNG|nr:WD40-repeat-containing domain protein [Blyttiomyces helicus]|eukprot:RKO93953.1 WD40-repeat-containing domain protein [Blyttiomyces helicus]